MQHCPVPLLDEIYATGKVKDAGGREYDLSANVDPEEGGMLYSLVADNKYSTGIEVGCAYGTSSLFICAAMAKQTSPSHTILDPCQTEMWHGIGIENLKRAGFSFHHLLEEPSEVALPRLMSEGRKFQFALIDGKHTLDHAMLDFFYVNLMLEEGGIVAFDDVHFPAINILVRYVLGYPNYELVATAGAAPQSGMRKVADGCLRPLSKLLPGTYRRAVFSDSWLAGKTGPVANCSMAALRKTGPDTRDWNWYRAF